MARVKSQGRTIVKSQPDHTVSVDEAKTTGYKPTRQRMIRHDDASHIAGDALFYRNWLIPNAKDKFPGQSKLWTVERYYPYAMGGPLLVDSPLLAEDITLARGKSKVWRNEGYRYLVIEPGMTEEDMWNQLEVRQ